MASPAPDHLSLWGGLLIVLLLVRAAWIAVDGIVCAVFDFWVWPEGTPAPFTYRSTREEP